MRTEHGLSERRACAAIGLERSVYHYEPRPNADGPIVKLLLELAWEALEDAGQPPDRAAGKPVAVYVGLTNFDYLRWALSDRSRVSSYSLMGGGLGMALNADLRFASSDSKFGIPAAVRGAAYGLDEVAG